MPAIKGRIDSRTQAAATQRIAFDLLQDLNATASQARSFTAKSKLATAASGIIREWRECLAVTRALRPPRRNGNAIVAPGTTPKATRPKPAMREEPTATAEVPAKAKESLSTEANEKDGGGGETPSE